MKQLYGPQPFLVPQNMMVKYKYNGCKKYNHLIYPCLEGVGIATSIHNALLEANVS